jgi:hypothetical protein
MIAKRPPLTLGEAIETTKVHSICGDKPGGYSGPNSGLNPATFVHFGALLDAVAVLCESGFLYYKSLRVRNLRVVAGEGFEPSTFRL